MTAQRIGDPTRVAPQAFPPAFLDVQERIEIRRATRRDLKRLLEIEAASFGRDAWDRELFVQALERCPEVFLIARLQARVAGYAITCIERNHAELFSIAVFPDARRRGVGEALIRHTLRVLRRRRLKTFGLMVRTGNKEAIRFYRRLGFRRIKTLKTYYAPGVDAWRMELVL